MVIKSNSLNKICFWLISVLEILADDFFETIDVELLLEVWF